MRLPSWKWFSDSFVDFELKNQYHMPGAQLQSSLMAILVGTFAAVGGFLYGYDTGLSNNVLSMNYVVKNFSDNGVAFSPSERAIMTASLSLGTLFGSIVSPLLSDTVGRKMAILFAALVVFNIGNICQVASTGSALLCVGRSITGSAIGVLSAVVPLYQSEASPKWVRGAIVSTYQWAITWGFLCSSAISQGTHSMNSTGSYRIPIGLQSGWALILSVGLFYLPESPRFYVMKDRIPEAAHSLSMLRRVPENDPGLIEELVDIKATHDFAKALTPFSYFDCFRSGPGRSKQGLRMMTGIFLQALQQATGINFIFYYGVWFFVKTGAVNESYLYSLLTYAVNVIGTIPGILLIEIIGRRKSLIYGGVGMSVSTFIIAIVGTAETTSIVTNKIMLAFVALFIFFFALTWGPGVWVITSEIFPLGVRGRAVSLSTATNWLFNFGFAFLSPYLIGGDTDSSLSLGVKIFFLWGSLNLFATVFSYFSVYETKGLRLEEIDEMYRTCKSARDSENFVCKGDGDRDNFEQLRCDIAHEVSQYNEHFSKADGILRHRPNNNNNNNSNADNSDNVDGGTNNGARVINSDIMNYGTIVEHPDKSKNEEQGCTKYIDIIQKKSYENRADGYNNDFEKNITSSSDGSTTIRASSAGAATHNQSTYVPLHLGESVTTNNADDHGSAHRNSFTRRIFTNEVPSSDERYFDLGYGFQVSNNIFQNGAPSISTSSSSSVSSLLEINIDGHDLREYVNNFQLRQHQQQMQQATHSEYSGSEASPGFFTTYLNNAHTNTSNGANTLAGRNISNIPTSTPNNQYSNTNNFSMTSYSNGGNNVVSNNNDDRTNNAAADGINTGNRPSIDSASDASSVSFRSSS